MPLVAKSDHSTGNSSFASYVLKSNELTFIFQQYLPTSKMTYMHLSTSMAWQCVL